MHVNDDKLGICANSYNVAYNVLKLKLFNVYYSTGLKIVGAHEPCLEKTCYPGL